MDTTLQTAGTCQKSAEFLEWLDQWYAALPAATLHEVLEGAGSPLHVAAMAVDLLVGFCSEGPLASPRVGALAPRAAAFLEHAWDAGVRHFLRAQDAHTEDALEFGAFPPHCLRGSREAEPIPELTRLPFFEQMVPLYKNSLNVGRESALREWQDAHPEVSTWILLGDCTDLCIYQAAMHFRVEANALGREATVWVPANLVDTYDLPVDVARQLGALPHDAELMHRIFLYHMALNGVRVVREITV